MASKAVACLCVAVAALLVLPTAHAQFEFGESTQPHPILAGLFGGPQLPFPPLPYPKAYSQPSPVAVMYHVNNYFRNYPSPEVSVTTIGAPPGTPGSASGNGGGGSGAQGKGGKGATGPSGVVVEVQHPFYATHYYDDDSEMSADEQWERSWKKFCENFSQRNPFLKQYLLEDEVLKEFYREEWGFPPPGTPTKKRAAKEAKAPLELEPRVTTPPPPVSGGYQAPQTGGVGPEPSPATTEHQLAQGTRPVATGGPLRSMFQVADATASITSSLVSPPWMGLWLTAYLMNEANRV